jgi:hypothetical protein
MKTPTSTLSRRNFLTHSAVLSAACTAASILPATLFSQSRAADNSTPAKKKYPIGIELYAVRGELSKDLPGTLRTVAKIGYEVVEFYSPYFAW